MGQTTVPVCTGPTGCRAKVNAVTAPKFPPPPRSAQNSSGCSSAEADVGAGHGQARRLGGLVDDSPGRAAGHGGHAPRGVDPHRDHRGQIEHQGPVGHGVAGVVVPASADAYRQPPVAGEPDRRLDIGHRQRLGDERGPVIMAGIPHVPRGVVVVLSREHDTPGQALAQRRGIPGGETGGHG